MAIATPEPEHESLGQYLHRTRSEKGLEIEQISSETRISARNLRAMETDHYATLPADAFARGLYGLYAKALGLDPDEIASRFTAQKNKILPQDSLPGFSKPPVGKTASKVNSMAEAPIIAPFSTMLLLLFLLLAVGGGLSWYFQINPISILKEKILLMQDKPLKPVDTSTAESPKALATTKVPDVQTPPAAEAVSSPAATGQQPSAAIPAQPQSGIARKYTLKAEFFEATRFTLTVDDGQKQELTFQAGEKIEWHANSKMVLSLPTGTSTRLILNDIPLALPKSKGKEILLAIPENLLD
jgi:cytoskeleton protein RodZ